MNKPLAHRVLSHAANHQLGIGEVRWYLQSPFPGAPINISGSPLALSMVYGEDVTRAAIGAAIAKMTPAQVVADEVEIQRQRRRNQSRGRR